MAPYHILIVMIRTVIPEILMLLTKNEQFGPKSAHIRPTNVYVILRTNLSLVFLNFFIYLIFRSNLFSITLYSPVEKALSLSLGSYPDFLPSVFPSRFFWGRFFLASVWPHSFQFVSGSSALLVFSLFPVSYHVLFYVLVQLSQFFTALYLIY